MGRQSILSGKSLAKNCMKMKEIGPRPIARIPNVPLEYANDIFGR